MNPVDEMPFEDLKDMVLKMNAQIPVILFKQKKILLEDKINELKRETLESIKKLTDKYDGLKTDFLDSQKGKNNKLI
jgi:hypothetical protein